ncbi:hypothetical protein PR202_gb07918 [Eleusine coracana subsp. coracana]|uniref:Uncharacterized protein n=1 Tax=Eleusine coracana subsp. coracana TaxID=191504 RepID=A0AAV5EDC7_ELECO|nr:hypothetical protein PR202_gb07918 [Eleusine coracana subsp. coracana]
MHKLAVMAMEEDGHGDVPSSSTTGTRSSSAMRVARRLHFDDSIAVPSITAESADRSACPIVLTEAGNHRRQQRQGVVTHDMVS